MENIKEQSEQLAQKQSWLRKGVEEWLEQWQQATSDDLDNENVEYVELYTKHDEMGAFYVYYLCRGTGSIYKVDGQTYNYVGYDGNSITTCYLDISLLREIMANVPDALDSYVEQMESEQEHVEKIADMLGKLN